MDNLSRALEQILAEAAADPKFKEALLADRLAAAEARGHQLSPSEQQILLAVPDDQLAVMVDRLGRSVEVGPKVRTITFAPQGIRPEAPAGVRPATDTLGIRPAPPTRGIRPEVPPDHRPNVSKGIRPGRVLLTAAAATAVTAGVASLYVTTGVRPDIPPPAVTYSVKPADSAQQRPADAGPPGDAARREPPEE